MPRVAPQQLELEVARVGPPETPRERAKWRPERSATAKPRSGSDGAARAAAASLLEVPEALLTRSHLRALGLERRAVDAVFRALPVVALPGSRGR